MPPEPAVVQTLRLGSAQPLGGEGMGTFWILKLAYFYAVFDLLVYFKTLFDSPLRP